jgi:hypothetical protein
VGSGAQATIPDGTIRVWIAGFEPDKGYAVSVSESGSARTLDVSPNGKVKSDAAGLLAITVSEAGEVAPVFGP